MSKARRYRVQCLVPHEFEALVFEPRAEAAEARLDSGAARDGRRDGSYGVGVIRGSVNLMPQAKFSSVSPIVPGLIFSQ